MIERGEPQALPKRGLSLDTCSKWGYTVGEYNGQKVQIANYCTDTGTPIAQKIRFADKTFVFLGDTKAVGLYGMHLWRDGGKRVVITEGEIDALSVSQLQDNKWPVVSLPNGASGAAKAVSKSIEWLSRFEEVVLCFDQDEPGRKAVEECAPLFQPGRCKVAKLPLKDANDMLKAGRGKEVIDAIWGAKTYRPDGIVSGTDLWQAVSDTKVVPSISYPWQGLQKMTMGLRKSEVVTFTAGTGVGKSQVCRELSHHLIKQGETVGIIALEETTAKTALGIMSVELNKPLHLSKEGISDEQLHTAFVATVGSGRVYLYDHFGSTDSDNLLNRIRFMVRGCGCGWILLDHLSIVVSGITDGDERRVIDNTMTKLRTLVQELGCGMILVSHLKRPEGKGHEEGAQTSLSQLRGSAAIGQLSDLVMGLERNQQSQEHKNLTCVRVLKNRFTGETGVACHLLYDPETGRMTETQPEFVPVEANTDF